MKLLQVYKCLCDETRLRILHLLTHRPLCVCHLQEILGAAQVKISKHLAYLREHAMVETKREGAWIIYSLPAKAPRELVVSLQCLQDCAREERAFRADLHRMRKVLAASQGPLTGTCGARTSVEKQKEVSRK